MPGRTLRDLMGSAAGGESASASMSVSTVVGGAAEHSQIDGGIRTLGSTKRL